MFVPQQRRKEGNLEPEKEQKQPSSSHNVNKKMSFTVLEKLLVEWRFHL